MDISHLSDEDIVEYLIERQKEMGASGIDDELRRKVAGGDAQIVIERYGRGVAVVTDQINGPGKHLWLLYVFPEHRGQGVGVEFVKELLERAGDRYLSVYCHGEQRSRFFEKCGMSVRETDRATGYVKLVG